MQSPVTHTTPWEVETGEAIGAHVTDSLAHITVNDRTHLKRGGRRGPTTPKVVL